MVKKSWNNNNLRERERLKKLIYITLFQNDYGNIIKAWFKKNPQ